MSDPLSNLSETFVEFYRKHVLNVFRYHLLRSSDWQDAEALTAETFRKAQTWFARRMADSGEAKIWLFRTAVSLYTRLRRPPGFAPLEESTVRPTQEQLSQFARVVELHEQWRRLPRKHQDARALYLFAGLELIEVAAVTGWKLTETAERLGQLTGNLAELRLLADQLQPVGYFSGYLENALRERAAGMAARHTPHLGGVRWGWLRYRVGPLLTTLGQVLPLVVLVGLVVWVVRDYNLQTAPAAEVASDPTSPPARRRRTSQPTEAVRFLPSQDSAILVSSSGALFAYRLAGGEFVRLSEDGFMPARGLNPDFPPQVSPDGAWLSLIDARDGSTWLFGLNGARARQISASSLHLTWAPGGGEAVYPLPDDPAVLYQYSAAAVYNRELARLPGEIKAVSWSPDGRLIGVAYQTPGSSPDTVNITLSLLPSRGGARVTLASQEEHLPVGDDSYVTPYRLFWTDDSSELWFSRWNAALNVSQALADALTAPRSNLKVGQNLDVTLHPLIGQPFSDRYDVRGQLLYGASRSGAPLLRNVVVSADRRRVAMLLANPDGVVGSVAMQDGMDLDQNRWIRNFGRVGKVSWTAESDSLLAAEYVDQPGDLYRIDARSGRFSMFTEGYWLLGTLSELREQAGDHAPQTVKIPLSGADGDGPTVRVEHPGLGISLEVPAYLRIWQLSMANANGALAVTNFDLGDALGYVSLDADDFLVEANRVAGPGTSMGRHLEMLAQLDPNGSQVEAFTIDGHAAYRVTFVEPDGGSEERVYIEDPNGPIVLYYLPTDSRKKAIFDQMVASLHLAPPAEATPTPSLTPQATFSGETAGERFTGPALALAFDLPILR